MYLLTVLTVYDHQMYLPIVLTDHILHRLSIIDGIFWMYLLTVLAVYGHQMHLLIVLTDHILSA